SALFLSTRWRRTRFSRDWSSDVWSSGLDTVEVEGVQAGAARCPGHDLFDHGAATLVGAQGDAAGRLRQADFEALVRADVGEHEEIGRASCRERAGAGVESGTVDTETTPG